MHVGCFGANMEVKGYRVFLSFKQDKHSSQLQTDEIAEGDIRVTLRRNFQMTQDYNAGGFYFL